MPSWRILDFDIENRPLSYLGPEFSTAEITAIAACWDGQPKTMRCWLLGRDDAEQMLRAFTELYDQADLVTGHFIRRHDLPIINGACMELGLPPLAAKLTCDTKLDLLRKGSAISASQENLCQMLGLPQPKIHMNNALWREANRLTPAGLEATAKRAVGDVIQHMALRKALLERNLLRAPEVWEP
jgi:hypothetical protein